MERDAPGTERERIIRQSMVLRAWDYRAYILLPAQAAPADGLQCFGTGAAGTVGGDTVGSNDE